MNFLHVNVPQKHFNFYLQRSPILFNRISVISYIVTLSPRFGVQF